MARRNEVRDGGARLHRFSFSQKHGTRLIETESRNSFGISSRDRWQKSINQAPRGRLWKIVLILDDSETERERGGSATNSESGWCKTRLVDPRDSLIEEGISLCAKQAGRIGLGRDGSQPKIGGRDRARTLARIFVLAPVLSSPRLDTSETNDLTEGKKRRRKKGRM